MYLQPKIFPVRQGGCSRWALQGCALVLAVGILGGWFVYGRLRATLQWGGAEGVKLFTQRAGERMRLPEPQIAAMNALAASYAAEIEAGRLPVSPSLNVLRAFDGGVLQAALLLHGWRGNFLASPGSSLDPGTVEAVLARFLAGVRARRIPDRTVASLTRLLTEKREITYRSSSALVIREKTFLLRQAMTREEVDAAVRFLEGVVPVAEADAAVGPIPEPVEVLGEAIASETGWRPGQTGR